MEAPSPSELEAIIRNVIHDLLEMPITPHVRELRAKAVTYGRVINNWSTYPPTGPQVEAMHECVSELHEKVKHARRDVSRVSRRPSTPRMSAPPASESTRKRSAPAAPPPTIPPGVAWNANVSDATGIRAKAKDASASPPSSHSGKSRPPAATEPPGSSPRPIDTPTPALLRSRRSR